MKAWAWKWADKEQEALRDMYNAGQPVTEIAKIIGRSENSIYSYIGKLGITRNKWTEETWAELKSLIESGVSIKKAAVKMGKTESLVKYKMRQMGLRSDLKGGRPADVWTEERTEYLRSQAGTDSWRDIARAIGVSHTAVRRKASMMDLTVKRPFVSRKGKPRVVKLPRLKSPLKPVEPTENLKQRRRLERMMELSLRIEQAKRLLRRAA